MAKTKKGFTIIEVVLVLAIAGLIFLMVFIALPALQRSQRNTQREDDISRFLTAANDYQTNNHGKTPFNVSSDGYNGVNKNFVSRYIDSSCSPVASGTDGSYTCTDGSEFTDPDGNVYKMNGRAWKSTDKTAGVLSGTFPNDHLVQAVTKATCGDENIAEEGSGDRQYALFYMLEGNSITCNDNH